LVVVGNEYLATRAKKAGAAWVESVPTVIDLERYPSPKKFNAAGAVPRIVWIGSPGTVPYLARLAEPLAALARRCDFALRVVGGKLTLPGINIECVDWTENSEVASIAEGDIGIMPLRDTPWERGKCGYKLIQYMACGLPVVASPVGVNQQIVREGENGFLASNNGEWVACLERLLLDPQLRAQMGAAGRQRVESEYCVQVTASRYGRLLSEAALPG
jgi:glycosyltransferase involved in cell wall biosynthesis